MKGFEKPLKIESYKEPRIINQYLHNFVNVNVSVAVSMLSCIAGRPTEIWEDS